jgi:hypothetical protein
MRYTRVTLVAIATFTLFCFLRAPAKAASVVAQAFEADSGATISGTLVSAVNGTTSKVEAATNATNSSIIGVIERNPIISLQSGQSGVKVAIAGTADTLVSDINGVIHAGDQISASPIAGVGMKATTSSQVIGTAAQNFTELTAKAQIITDKAGIKHTVHIQQLPVQIAVSYYVSATSSFVPPFIQSLAQSIAGKPVSAARVLFASVLAIAAIIGVTVLISSAVRSGIVSIGRNPLASKAIWRSLFGIGLTILLLMTLSIIVIDLILTY